MCAQIVTVGTCARIARSNLVDQLPAHFVGDVAAQVAESQVYGGHL